MNLVHQPMRSGRRDIESRPLLELDCVLPSVVQWLETWRVVATNFVLVTVRSNPQAVREQLGRLDLMLFHRGDCGLPSLRP